MSILTTTAAIAATALVAGFAIGQITGPSITTEIEIDAPADAVWAQLAHTEAYADWNPFVRNISGDLETGTYLQVTVGADGSSKMDFTPEVLVAAENKELRWVGRLGFRGIFDGEHYFILEETDRGTTIFHHGENFTGLLGFPLIALIREDTHQGFMAMNEALKARVEGKS
ncbi:SRPBCC domain-containing protein [Aliiroseovarius subalbicans]|uniref:SRPBCC domain-containing protein n=1 Tax=Aliiroseovarius subalbicans TaxID=2925840 RepID=UPI001F58CB9E|nr:SRPBCC domain-containing protein [Aliiroseovarius subalbicans]MCI2398974.1 SRPBCC domain-containing protein [Aliiroseovarius subalbicans]